MSTPFYVSPEQWYQDKAEYARKGIARGKPIVALEYEHGIVMMAENRSATPAQDLARSTTAIAFGGVGKLDEYENLRKAGVRYADMRGYSFSREDVAGKSLANEYSTVLGSRLHARDEVTRGRDPRRRDPRRRQERLLPDPLRRQHDRHDSLRVHRRRRRQARST